MNDDWQKQLEDAFGILLKKPIPQFSTLATYAFYVWQDPEMGTFSNPAKMTLAEMVVPQKQGKAGELEVRVGESVGALNWGRYAVDYHKSYFTFDDGDMPEDLLAIIKKARTFDQYKYPYFEGNELFAILKGDEDLWKKMRKYLWFVTRRIVTDGSLFDAMCTATWTTSEKYLHSAKDAGDMADKVVIDPVWEKPLAEIANKRLREHLALLCVDAETGRWYGAYRSLHEQMELFLAPAVLNSNKLIAKWMVGEGQGWGGVVESK